IISMMPAGKLIEYKDAERVTDIEKMIVRRIVRHPNGVHVHIFYQLHVLDAERLTQRPAGGRPEGMTADALELYFYVIDIDAIALPQLDGPEAKPLFNRMHRTARTGQRVYHLIQMRGFGVPGLRMCKIG